MPAKEKNEQGALVVPGRRVEKPTPPSATRFTGPGGLEMWRLKVGHAVAEIAPSRGGLVTRFAVGDDEILYLDPRTLTPQPGQGPPKVRGGIPVLFPIAGRLAGDRFTVPFVDDLGAGAGRGPAPSFPMRQHGLARLAPWSVSDVAQAHLTMEFRSGPQTRVNFPYDFVLRMTVDLERAGHRTLALELEVENLGKQPMPVHLGLHPYFLLPETDKAQARLEIAHESSAESPAVNNVTGETVHYAGSPDFAGPELDLHLTGVATETATLHVPGTTPSGAPKSPRVLAWSDLFSTVVLWSVAMSDFVCVEPWSAPGNALNTGQDLMRIEPGESVEGEFSITV